MTQTYRSVIASRSCRGRLRCSTCSWCRANINELDPALVCPPGPFDAAFCRLFLFHQTDPAATLSQIASIVRPGGYIVAHEAHVVGPPSSTETPELQQVMDLWTAVMRARGAHPEVSVRLPELCAQAGLQEVDRRGFFANIANRPDEGFAAYRTVTVSFRAAAIEHGVMTADAFDAMLATFDRAATRQYDLLAGVMFVEMVARVPE